MGDCWRLVHWLIVVRFVSCPWMENASSAFGSSAQWRSSKNDEPVSMSYAPDSYNVSELMEDSPPGASVVVASKADSRPSDHAWHIVDRPLLRRSGSPFRPFWRRNIVMRGTKPIHQNVDAKDHTHPWPHKDRAIAGGNVDHHRRHWKNYLGKVLALLNTKKTLSDPPKDVGQEDVKTNQPFQVWEEHVSNEMRGYIQHRPADNTSASISQVQSIERASRPRRFGGSYSSPMLGTHSDTEKENKLLPGRLFENSFAYSDEEGADSKSDLEQRFRHPPGRLNDAWHVYVNYIMSRTSTPVPAVMSQGVRYEEAVPDMASFEEILDVPQYEEASSDMVSLKAVSNVPQERAELDFKEEETKQEASFRTSSDSVSFETVSVVPQYEEAASDVFLDAVADVPQERAELDVKEEEANQEVRVWTASSVVSLDEVSDVLRETAELDVKEEGTDQAVAPWTARESGMVEGLRAETKPEYDMFSAYNRTSTSIVRSGTRFPRTTDAGLLQQLIDIINAKSVVRKVNGDHDMASTRGHSALGKMGDSALILQASRPLARAILNDGDDVAVPRNVTYLVPSMGGWRTETPIRMRRVMPGNTTGSEYESLLCKMLVRCWNLSVTITPSLEVRNPRISAETSGRWFQVTWSPVLLKAPLLPAVSRAAFRPDSFDNVVNSNQMIRKLLQGRGVKDGGGVFVLVPGFLEPPDYSLRILRKERPPKGLIPCINCSAELVAPPRQSLVSAELPESVGPTPRVHQRRFRLVAFLVLAVLAVAILCAFYVPSYLSKYQREYKIIRGAQFM